MLFFTGGKILSERVHFFFGFTLFLLCFGKTAMREYPILKEAQAFFADFLIGFISPALQEKKD
jgi:hypothetical protein